MNDKLMNEFSEFLKEKGYSPKTIYMYSKALKPITDMGNTFDPHVLYEHINENIKTLEPSLTDSKRKNTAAATRQFFHFKTGMIYKDYVQEVVMLSNNCEILHDFFVYSTDFKHISSESAKSECQHISVLFSYLQDVTYEKLADLEACDIRDYICTMFKDLKNSTIGRYITSFRNFFKFLEYKGQKVNQSLFMLPLSSADWAKGNIPIVLSNDEEDRLRNHHPANSTNDVRNRLIILLMLDMGMRYSEVSNLKLTDISWNSGTVKVHNNKNLCERILPIPQNIGQLLEVYVLTERAPVTIDVLFLREYLQNHIPMNIGSVRRVVREAYQKENIHGWWKGSHALRRTAASRIYNSGVGLKITADFLGHKSIDSTTAYVKVDFESLRKITLPWPGGDSND